jgi:hypothetical protein
LCCRAPSAFSFQRSAWMQQNFFARCEEVTVKESIRFRISQVPSTAEPGKRQLEVGLQRHLESTSRRLPYAIRRYDRGYFHLSGPSATWLRAGNGSSLQILDIFLPPLDTSRLATVYASFVCRRFKAG